MNESERLKLLSEIIEIGKGIKQSIFIMSICFVCFVVTFIIAILELFRLGFDMKTAAWYIMSAIFIISIRENSVDYKQLELYTSLVKEYQKKYTEE